LPIAKELLRKRFYEALDKAGIPRLRLYSLRHTMATLVLHETKDIKLVAARLGHANEYLVLRRYGHLLPGVDREATELLSPGDPAPPWKAFLGQLIRSSFRTSSYFLYIERWLATSSRDRRRCVAFQRLPRGCSRATFRNAETWDGGSDYTSRSATAEPAHHGRHGFHRGVVPHVV
jgi:hypothetical protein